MKLPPLLNKAEGSFEKKSSGYLAIHGAFALVVIWVASCSKKPSSNFVAQKVHNGWNSCPKRIP